MIFFIQYLGIGSKKKGINSNNCCPDCNKKLVRIKRIFKDKIIIFLTLGMLDWRRYSCEECGWEGIRWNRQQKYKRH